MINAKKVIPQKRYIVSCVIDKKIFNLIESHDRGENISQKLRSILREYFKIRN